MTATTAMLRGRSLAESLMTSEGVMYSPTGRSAQNNDGEEVPLFATEYTSICKVQARSGDDSPTRTETVGGVERPVFEAGLHLPVSDRDVRVGWEFEVTSVAAFSDALLLGKRYRIVGVPLKSYSTARRLDVVEV